MTISITPTDPVDPAEESGAHLAKEKPVAVWDILPSKRLRPRWVKVPEGMLDVWRVSYRTGTNGQNWLLDGFFMHEVHAWERADALWKVKRRDGLRVEHKAGLLVEGKIYLVNIMPIKFKDECRNPTEEANEKFLSDFVNPNKTTKEIFDSFVPYRKDGEPIHTKKPI